MTDRGRGTGSEPWHSSDPLYGDLAGPAAQGWQPDPYGAGAYQQPDWNGQLPPQQDAWGAPGAPSASLHLGPGDPYGQPPTDPHGRPATYGGQPGYPAPDPYAPTDPYLGGHDFYDPPDTYAQQSGYGPQDPYGPGYGFDPDPRYASQPPDPGQGPFGEPGYGDGAAPYDDGHLSDDPRNIPQANPNAGLDEGQDDHAFFSDTDDDLDDEASPGTRRGRNEGGRKQRRGKTRRSGCACLTVLLVLGGGVGAAGYFGFQFYQSHFGAPPDYAGSGTGEAQIEVPEGAFTADIAKILVDNDVVKSSQAFIDAAQKDDAAARAIQPGVYTMKKQMSAASALDILTNTANLNTLTIPEGWRSAQIYQAIDKKLHLKAGATKDAAEAAAKDADLGLPEYAKNNVEGFLYPSRYSVGKNTKPVDVLKQMVKQAVTQYDKDDLDQAAGGQHKTAYEIITIASIVQAEAQEDKDFGKVARVIYNRLDTDATNGKLDMDSTINYALGRSTLDTSSSDTRLNHPYNTYVHKGLPPGPIGNPGRQAIEAALNPTPGNWVYFVTVKPGDTRFTNSKAEHDKNVSDFNAYRREHGDD